MAYVINDPFIAPLPIANTDAGFVPPRGVSDTSFTTVSPTPPLTLGMIVRATDPTFGFGEFILLCGVASTAIGTVVQYDASTFTTSIPTAATVNKSGMPMAVAMSANIVATTFGWYQIAGTAVVKKTTVKFSNKQAIGFISTGIIGKNASGVQILGARTANASSVASAVTTINVTISRPVMMGRIT